VSIVKVTVSPPPPAPLLELELVEVELDVVPPDELVALPLALVVDVLSFELLQPASKAAEISGSARAKASFEQEKSRLVTRAPALEGSPDLTPNLP
jgi:hypothetical protein